MRLTSEQFAEVERRRQAGRSKPTSTQRMQAKGRLAPGQMNKSEAAYAAVLEGRKQAGDILWWVFEGIKLRLAANTFLTVDFALMRADGVVEFHDVKGAKAIIQDDAKVKMKVAAEAFPFPFFYAFPPKRKGEQWTLEAVGHG